MNFSKFRFAGTGLAAMLLFAGVGLRAEEGVRTITLRQSDAQVRYGSRIYELKHTTSEALLPFIQSAVMRYSRNSSVRRITSGKGEALLVNTGIDFLPDVDSIVAALDRPGLKDGKSGSIQSTGVARMTYSPNFRAAAQFSELVNLTIGSSAGKAYVNPENNTIFWKDQKAAAEETLKWIRTLDRALPQISLRLNYYELRDSDLKDWGFDYLAWKNGPGVNMLNVGYNAGHLAVDELLGLTQYLSSASWAYGGFFTAPQIDMSFIRCLQQSGNASVAAHAIMLMVSTPVRNLQEYQQILKAQAKNLSTAPNVYRVSMTPEYQNISKNALGRTVIGKSYNEDTDGNKYGDPPRLDAFVCNPFVCQPADKEKGGVLFSYQLFFKNVVERGNTGSELSNSVALSGAATLGFGQEKVLGIYEKENDVEQTVGLPILSRIPWVKYLFSTVTTIKERTYIIISAEAVPVSPEIGGSPVPVSETKEVKRRIENPFRKDGK